MKLRTQFLLGSGILVVVLIAMAALVVSTRTQVAGLRSQHEIANSVQQEANDLASLSSSYLLYGDQVLKDRWDSLVRLLLARCGSPEAGVDRRFGTRQQHQD